MDAYSHPASPQSRHRTRNLAPVSDQDRAARQPAWQHTKGGLVLILPRRHEEGDDDPTPSAPVAQAIGLKRVRQEHEQQILIVAPIRLLHWASEQAIRAPAA